MCMCKHAHLYRSASAPGWLTPTAVTVTVSDAFLNSLVVLIIVMMGLNVGWMSLL